MSKSSELCISPPELKLLVSGSADAYSTTIDGWTLSEFYTPNVYWFDSMRCGSYRVTLTRELPEREDHGVHYIHGCYLAEALDRAWIYATGMPLSGRGHDLFMAPVSPPADWTSNAETVLPTDDWQTLRSRVSYLSPYRSMPKLPLESAVKALFALRDAGEVTNQIADFHQASMAMVVPELTYLLLAQGIECALSSYSEGKRTAIPTAVAKHLKHDLNWLSEMSHQRRETRHAVDKKTGVALKQSFDLVEG